MMIENIKTRSSIIARLSNPKAAFTFVIVAMEW